MEKIMWRRATRADLPRIVDIYNQAVRHGIATDDTDEQTVAGREEWFNAYNDQHPLWVIVKQEHVVGWVGLETFFDHPNFSRSVQISIYFDNHYQHQHLGTATLKFIDQQASEMGIKTIVSYIYERNHPSQMLFQQNGYHYAGELTDIAYLNGEYRSVKIYIKHF